MSSRYAAARPKRAGEEFARSHRNENEDGPSKKPKFDLRNPSALVADEPEEDAVLDADVIGSRGTGTKRGAINIDGYDSDSDNEGFDARADERARGKKGEVNLAAALDGYSKEKSGAANGKTDIEEDADMFADLEDEFADGDEDESELKARKKGKEVRFLKEDEIEGQVLGSKSGGHISGNFTLDPKGKLSTHAMDDQESSDDEEDAVLAAQEEDVDEEVGAGGLKRNAPKVDAFNMKAEQEEGKFDANGNFVRNAADRDAVHDSWLEGISKKEMKKAAEAHEKREEERRQKRLEDDAIEKRDSPRGTRQTWKGPSENEENPKMEIEKATPKDDSMDVDAEKAEDPEQVRIREAINAITGAADQLLIRGQTDVYEQEREMLIRQYRRETGEEWVEPPGEVAVDEEGGPKPTKMWEYRWTDGRDGAAKQGPFDGPTMVAWQDAGYFGEGVEFRRVGQEGGWSRVVDFV